MDIDTKDFGRFLDLFGKRKNNLLRQSNATPIKRLQIVTLDLSADSLAQDGHSNLWKIPSNFTGIHLEKIYDTTTLVKRTGEIYVVFDDPNLGGISNSKLLQAGDSFDLINGEVANAWLYWSAQGNTSARLAFFIDFDYRAGSTATTIISDVSVFTSPGESVAIRPLRPDLSHEISQSVNGSTSYTIPAGYTGYVWGSVSVFAASMIGAVTVNNANITQCFTTTLITAMSANSAGVAVIAGDVIVCNNTGASVSSGAVIKLWLQ